MQDSTVKKIGEINAIKQINGYLCPRYEKRPCIHLPIVNGPAYIWLRQ